MKTKLITLLLAIVANVGVFAESGTCGDNLTWDLTDGVLTISGTGEMYSYGGRDGEPAPWDEQKESIQKVIVNEGVTAIGGCAFLSCTNLVSVSLPDGLEKICNEAFSHCSNLTTINIPSSVEYIANGLLDDVFAGCESLPVIDNVGYADTYLAGVVDTTQSSYNIKEGTRWIGCGAFFGCANLKTIHIPNSVFDIGTWAFMLCTSLEMLEIPNSVKTIGGGAFMGCVSLKQIYIPANVTELGYTPFHACSDLEAINVDAGNLSYSSIDGVLFDKHATTLIHYPCGKSLDTYIIPNNVTKVEDNAFWGNVFLNSVTISDNVTTISDGAFYGCSGLTSVVIGKNVETIEDQAFADCSALTSLTCRATMPPRLKYSSFNGIDYSKAYLYVPEESIELYKETDGWKNFNYILPIPESPTDVKNVTTPIISQKYLMNGQILIERNGRTYTQTGQEISTHPK